MQLNRKKLTISEVKEIRESAVTTKKNMRKGANRNVPISNHSLATFSHQTVLLCDMILRVHKVVTNETRN